jgi:hypothetical protein
LLNEHGAVIMAAWPFMFPQFFAQMTSVGGDALGLCCVAFACAAFMTLSRRNDLPASLGLGLALGLGVWANTLLVTLWLGLALYLGWRSWRLHRAHALDGEWLVLRVFALSLALLIATGWVVFAVFSSGPSEMTPVLGPGFAERLWATIATFSADGGASEILPGPGWRLISLGLLVVILARWELNWRALPPLAQAPAFILPVFTLSALLLGLQGYASGFGDLHMLAAFLGLATALCCRTSGLAMALVVLGLSGALAQGLFQASVFSGCAVYDPQLGRYGYEGARCVLDLDALGAVSAPLAARESVDDRRFERRQRAVHPLETVRETARILTPPRGLLITRASLARRLAGRALFSWQRTTRGPPFQLLWLRDQSRAASRRKDYVEASFTEIQN